MVSPFLRRPRFQHRLPVIIRRFILVIASILIAYYVLSTFLKGLAEEDHRQDAERANSLIAR